MAVPNLSDINNLLNQYKIRLNENINNYIKNCSNKLDSLKNSYILKNPMSMYEVKEQKLDSYIDILNKLIKNKLDAYQVRLDNISSKYVLNNPMSMLDNKVHKYELLLNTLELVNPLNILSKGYSVVKSNDKVIKSYKDLKKDDIINIKLHEGNVSASVIEVSE